MTAVASSCPALRSPWRLALIAAAALALAGCGGGPSTDRIVAIFDDAAFVGAGQEVRIAGADAGTVSSVTLTRDRKARVEIDLQPQFAPFRSDARCTIEPQSLIGEKFVSCNPGTARARALLGHDGRPATIPLAQNQSPVDLDAVVAMLGQPTNVRIQLLLNELGAGTAARGEDLSAAIRRAVPALGYARTTLTRLAGDRAAIRRAIGAVDAIVGTLDRRRGQLAATFDDSAELLRATVDRRAQLDRALATFPGTLHALDPALDDLTAVTHDARLTLASLRRAAPDVRRLAGDVEPVARLARPALRRLSTTARRAVPILRRAAPQLVRLRQAVEALAPGVPLAAALGRSLERNDVPEFTARFMFYGAMAGARFDDVSHFLPAHVTLTPCLLPAQSETEGCSAHLDRPEAAGDAGRARWSRSLRAAPPSFGRGGATR